MVEARCFFLLLVNVHNEFMEPILWHAHESGRTYFERVSLGGEGSSEFSIPIWCVIRTLAKTYEYVQTVWFLACVFGENDEVALMSSKNGSWTIQHLETILRQCGVERVWQMGLACGQIYIFLQLKISTVQKNVLQGICLWWTGWNVVLNLTKMNMSNWFWQTSRSWLANSETRHHKWWKLIRWKSWKNIFNQVGGLHVHQFTGSIWLVGAHTHTHAVFFRAIQQMWRSIFTRQKNHTRHLHCTVRNMCIGYKAVPHS